MKTVSRAVLICCVLAIALVVNTSAADVVSSGYCGADTGGRNLTWTLDRNGTLTISGTGEMANYREGESPWFARNTSIRKVIIENGVTGIGMLAFEGCENLTEATISYTVANIRGQGYRYTWGRGYGGNAFADCTNLTVSGYDGSAIQAYADLYNFAWRSIGAVPSNYMNEIYITPDDIDEFYQLPKGNTRFILADGVYKRWIEFLDVEGYNVIIEAEHPGCVELLQEYENTSVIRISNDASYMFTSNITLRGLIMGHSVDAIYSESCGEGGYVLSTYGINGLTIENCDLWGCGIVAVDIDNCENVVVKDSVLRDCVWSAVGSSNSTASFENCVISGTAYRSVGWYDHEPCVRSYESDLTFTNCHFFNNKNGNLVRNARYAGNEEAGEEADILFLNGGTMHDNTWQNGQIPQYYGVCLGGVVWKAIENASGGYTLRLGEDIVYSDGTRIVSAKGAIPNYTEYSLPWKNLNITETVDLRDSQEPGPTPAPNPVLPGEIRTIAIPSETNTVTIDYSDTGLNPETAYTVMYGVYNSEGMLLSVFSDRLVFTNAFFVDLDISDAQPGTVRKIFLISDGKYTPIVSTVQLRFIEG